MLGPKGTAPILPGTNQGTLNELIRLKVFEKVGANRIRPTDEFIRMYHEVEPARYNETESYSNYDRTFAISERVKLVLPKLAAKQGKTFDDSELLLLVNDTTNLINIIQQTDEARKW